MNKNELIFLHELQAEAKKDIEESAGIDDVENYISTSFGDELINQMETDRREYDGNPPFIKEDIAGKKYSDDNIKISPTSVHKGKKKHRCAVLALSRVVAKASKNKEILDMMNDEAKEAAREAVSSVGMSFTDYGN